MNLHATVNYHLQVNVILCCDKRRRLDPRYYISMLSTFKHFMDILSKLSKEEEEDKKKEIKKEEESYKDEEAKVEEEKQRYLF